MNIFCSSLNPSSCRFSSAYSPATMQ
ncbi:hypothetical protein ACNKHV_24005 [Shigella flexneri]